jgi:hypothetical protein
MKQFNGPGFRLKEALIEDPAMDRALSISPRESDRVDRVTAARTSDCCRSLDVPACFQPDGDKFL